MKYINFKLFKFILMTFLLFFSQASVLASEQNMLRQQLQSFKEDQLIIGQSKIAAAGLIHDFYQANDYQLAWKKQSMIDVLLNAIDESYRVGLSPDDYHFAEIKDRIDGGLNKTGEQRAQLDIIMTDALIRLVYHLTYGKVVPGKLDPDWNFSREFMSADPVAKLHYSLRAKQDLKKLLDRNIRSGPFWQGLIKALTEYRQIQQSGGWMPVPSGQTIKPGRQDPRMPFIKARLQATGDLKNENIDLDDYNYNAEVEAGIRHFQQRHQLDVDGVVGKDTLGQMNVPVEQRIDQIRANLERIRWVQRDLGNEFVLVNIAGYQVYYVRENTLVWESRVQVGTNFRKTPVFRDNIEYLVFNPTWTVPPTILSKDILPKIKKDRSYLQKKNMKVIDAKGNVINPAAINWPSMTAKNFPYMIRQDPGPANALGRVKIMFPNKHLVYLHDTPSKNKFNRVERAFSSGCIRVEKPFELVELLLKDSSTWNQARFKEMVALGQLQNVSLPKSVPVLLLYFTAAMDENGQVIFYKDIYKRDDKVIQGLKQPFHLEVPEQKKVVSLRMQ
jgi:murein L,D-transpeptidase YcbB/YkuD